MTGTQEFVIPGLATVRIGGRRGYSAEVEIVLDPAYRGDLNDIAHNTPGPDDVYLRCNDMSALDSAELAQFMEVLSHWDHTGDGIPDCDHILAAIDDALWRADDKPKLLQRPVGGWYVNSVMAMMPPQPKHHIVLSFGNLKPRYRWYHHAVGLIMLLFVFATINVQLHFAPWTQYSVITGFFAFAEWVGISTLLALIIFIVGINLRRKRTKDAARMHSPHTYGFFNKASVYEEQAFREGAEHWTTSQRFRSCLAFGAIHMVNLIYPLATILPLTVGGALFMWVYLRTLRRTHFRRTAVLEAAVWHRVYNRMALTALVLVLLSLVGWWVVTLVAAFGLGKIVSDALKQRKRPAPVAVAVPAPVE